MEERSEWEVGLRARGRKRVDVGCCWASLLWVGLVVFSSEFLPGTASQGCNLASTSLQL
jgi:hypothetical protein